MSTKLPIRTWLAPPSWFARDAAWSLALHRAAVHRPVVRLLVGVSRLGDGGLWYGLMLVLPWLHGPEGITCALAMFGVGLINLILYKVVKHHVARPRPYVNCPEIRACTPALDQHSFPSGHTLHAVGFSIVLTAYFPTLAIAAWPFTLLVAFSRVVLGLHYPSDVLGGAALGAVTAGLMVWLL